MNDLVPLHTIDGVDTGGLSEEHWHFAYTIFHTMGKQMDRKGKTYQAYPVKLIDPTSTRSGQMRHINDDHVHFTHNNTHVEKVEVLGKGSYGTAYLTSVYTQEDLSDERLVVIKVSQVREPAAIEPQPASASAKHEHLQHVIPANTWYLDVAVMEPFTMAVLQQRWSHRYPRMTYPAAQLLCSFLVEKTPGVHYEQITVMSFESGTELCDFAGASYAEAQSKFLECFRQSTDFVWRAHRDFGINVMDRHSENSIVRDADGQLVQLDLAISSVEWNDFVIAAWPDHVGHFHLCPDPMVAMRGSWAHVRQLFLKEMDFGSSIERHGLRAAVEARQYPQAWLFENLVQRARITGALAEALSVEKDYPPELAPLVRDGKPPVITLNETHRAVDYFKKNPSEEAFAPLDYSATAVYGYGYECAKHLTMHHFQKAVDIVERYVQLRSAAIKTYLPMLIFAAVTARSLRPEPLPDLVRMLQRWYRNRPSLVSLLPVFVDVKDMGAALRMLAPSPHVQTKMMTTILHAIEPVAALASEKLFDDEREAVGFFDSVWTTLTQEKDE